MNSKTQIQTFNDGILDIYKTDDSGDKLENASLTNIYFQKRTAGITRIYQAAQASEKFTDVVRVALGVPISPYDIVVINGADYEVKLVQEIYDTIPKSKDLTLNKAVR